MSIQSPIQMSGQSVAAVAYLEAMGVSLYARPEVRLVVESAPALEEVPAVEVPKGDEVAEVIAKEVVVEPAEELVLVPLETADPIGAATEHAEEMVEISLPVKQFTIVRLQSIVLLLPTQQLEAVYTTTHIERQLLQSLASAMQCALEIDFMPPLSGPQVQYFKGDQQILEGLQHYLQGLSMAGVTRVVLIGGQLEALSDDLQSTDAVFKIHALASDLHDLSVEAKKNLWRLLTA